MKDGLSTNGLAFLLVGLLCLVLSVVFFRVPADDPPDAPQATLYPSVPLATIASGKWLRPRAEVTGTVTEVRKEADGDWHIRLVEGSAFIVLEVIPELPIPLPKMGDRIAARGVVRYDGEHGGWGELHPLVSWKVSP